MSHRLETDSLGAVEVAQTALFAAQTQRALNNFKISSLRMPPRFIASLGLIKAACAKTNSALGLLDETMGEAIYAAAMAVAAGEHDDQFPVDVFQTGSGTSTNMNANEVIATLASRRLSTTVHPNDHVNCSQSSNDVIPTAIHVSAQLALEQQLMPALEDLMRAIERREQGLGGQLKIGRTHLMDALPISLGQELSGWRAQLSLAASRIRDSQTRLVQLAQGGTAVGTGVNAPASFAEQFAQALSRLSGQHFRPADNAFAAISSQDTAVEVSGQLKTLAVALLKIANDLRWMNSGPLAGLAEIRLEALQPGSSIMPGKVNPVVPEAVAMAAVQVMGNDTTISCAGGSGNFQLNVMLPVIAYNLLQSIDVLAGSCRALSPVITAFSVNAAALEGPLARNPILATALNRDIGYSKAADIAKRAYAEKRPILAVAIEMTDLDPDYLAALLAPDKLI
ncbi:fumarase class II [Paraperlucidibaca baekdonensis]|uniref:Fumarate hydratase class II n=1 Tax=Paraperlucidibaca baekdonensis TaxID=748120 RepID=A0A3E0H6K0_9GAMM|nr:class II fumarate hydratase [Paraperlucidibaca baekdonensis]REH39131.1 fumarase class II [Paraperlucidibaca baekdonensis]